MRNNEKQTAKEQKDELTADELEEVSGGESYVVHHCKNCHRIAVMGMDLCAVCYREQAKKNL